MENIQAAGFRVPTPIQMQAIPVMLHVSFLVPRFATGSMAEFGERPLLGPWPLQYSWRVLLLMYSGLIGNINIYMNVIFYSFL